LRTSTMNSSRSGRITIPILNHIAIPRVQTLTSRL
jgi:hypothetical protein